jgi:uncharacterized Zn-finger protein
MSMAEAAKKQEQVVKVSRDQLPMCCPLPEDSLWNMHPRVFLPMEKTGEARCPYCGTRYVLQD